MVKETTKTGELFGPELEGVNQIRPHMNKWAWNLYVVGKHNNWVPEDIPMQKDIANWRNGVITDDEKLVIKRCLGFFAGSESLVGNNLVTMYKYITDPECRQYMSRQIYEECLHNDTIVYICDSLDLNESEVYEAYETIPAIKAKDEWLMSVTKGIGDADTSTTEGRTDVLRAAFLYWVVCEGTFFFSGFAMLLAMRDKIPGICEQIEYTLRDETGHISFGTQMLCESQQQYPEVWTSSFKNELIGLVKKAVELEVEYAKECLPNGVLGLNSDMFVQYMEYIGNRRLEAVNIDFRFDSDTNPFEFLSENQDTKKQKNFFETKVIDYQSAGALDDDF